LSWIGLKGLAFIGIALMALLIFAEAMKIGTILFSDGWLKASRSLLSSLIDFSVVLLVAIPIAILALLVIRWCCGGFGNHRKIGRQDGPVQL
jgi:hypothetical protein